MNQTVTKAPPVATMVPREDGPAAYPDAMVRRLPDPAYTAIGAILTHPWFHPFHRRLYRRTGGRGLVGHALGVDMVLLGTIGRRSGRTRTVPLGAIRVGDSWVVIGSYGGRDVDPAWVLNLRAQPKATVQFRRARTAALAHEADPAEATRLWPLVRAGYPGYQLYRERTTRTVPLFVLEPVGEIA